MRLKSARRRAMCGLLPACFWLAFSSSATSSAEFPTKYDGPIRNAVDKWWPDVPFWKLWKAQLYAESRLDPNATSPVGAEGVAQFMPGTWSDAIKALGYPQTASRRDAAYAIEGGAWYMGRLRRQWKPRDTRTLLESHYLAVASYNRGVGWIVKDQAECGGAPLWSQIEVCTGRHTMETVTYVRRIQGYWQQMELK